MKRLGYFVWTDAAFMFPAMRRWTPRRPALPPVTAVAGIAAVRALKVSADGGSAMDIITQWAQPLRLFRRSTLIAAAFLAIGGSGNARALPFSVAITVDNEYALYYGTRDQAVRFVGADASWSSTETYAFDLPADEYIYIVTQSDLRFAQGLLAQFTDTATHQRFYSNDPQWQVAATGRYGFAPSDGSLVDMTELSTQLGLANRGADPSGGWVPTTAGGANGSQPWGLRPDIDTAAHWVWYDKKQDGSNPTLGGYNDDEYLIFRIAVAAAPLPVPEPGNLPLLLTALVLLGISRHHD
jgi:hypothetical protein